MQMKFYLLNNQFHKLSGNQLINVSSFSLNRCNLAFNRLYCYFWRILVQLNFELCKRLEALHQNLLTSSLDSCNCLFVRTHLQSHYKMASYLDTLGPLETIDLLS